MLIKNYYSFLKNPASQYSINFVDIKMVTENNWMNEISHDLLLHILQELLQTPTKQHKMELKKAKRK